MSQPKELTPEQRAEIWQRGQKALQKMLTLVVENDPAASVAKIESLVAKMENPAYRSSITFKLFINSL